MINNLQISVRGGKLTNKIRNYALKKIGGLDKYIPKRARESAFVEIKLMQKRSNNQKLHECEVIIKLPKERIMVHKDALKPLAAIDEVEANLKTQLKKYKDLHTWSKVVRHKSPKLRRFATPDGLV